MRSVKLEISSINPARDDFFRKVIEERKSDTILLLLEVFFSSFTTFSANFLSMNPHLYKKMYKADGRSSLAPISRRYSGRYENPSMQEQKPPSVQRLLANLRPVQS
jgi:hypothetical protein